MTSILGRAMAVGAAVTIALAGYTGLGWATLPQTQAVAVPAVTAPSTAVVGAHMRSCVRKRDYRKVRTGMTRSKVAWILHNRGRMVKHRLVLDRNRQWRLVMVYHYPACGRARYVRINYRENPSRQVENHITLTVTRKAWVY
jgi:hypothetical protein